MLRFARYLLLLLLILPNSILAYDYIDCGGIVDTDLVTDHIPTSDTIHGITVFVIHPEEADSRARQLSTTAGTDNRL
jgi:hypothetical protein